MPDDEQTPRDLPLDEDDERPEGLECPVCGRILKHAGALTGHLRTHEKGDKPAKGKPPAPAGKKPGFRPPTGGMSDAELERSLAGNYGLVGMGMEMVGMTMERRDPGRGHKVRVAASGTTQLGPDAAKAWVALGSYSPTLRRGLEMAAAGGVIGAVANLIMVHAAILMYAKADGKTDEMPPMLRFGLDRPDVPKAPEGFDISQMMQAAAQAAASMDDETRAKVASAMGGITPNGSEDATDPEAV